MDENKILFSDDEGNLLELYILEETKFNGDRYILVSEDDDEECFVMKDVSREDEEIAVYEFASDEEAEAVFEIFVKLLEEDDE